MGDNEFAVRTIETQTANLQSSYPASIKGVQDVEIRPKNFRIHNKTLRKRGTDR